MPMSETLRIWHLGCHLGIHLKQFFEPFGIIFEAAAYIDALKHFVIMGMSRTQVFGHGVGLIEISDGGGEMGFAGQQDIFGGAGKVVTVFFA